MIHFDALGWHAIEILQDQSLGTSLPGQGVVDDAFCQTVLSFYVLRGVTNAANRRSSFRVLEEFGDNR